jgi:Tfp pilus assembly protein PilE
MVMRRTYKSMLGVTLLEIMLVLAIAALVIVMSIRFYQQASTSGKINAALSQVQGIVAAVESWQTATQQPYSNLTSMTVIKDYLPSQNASLVNPWGGTVSLGTQGSGFKITYNPAIPTSGQNACQTLGKYFVQNGYTFDTTTCTTVNITP